MDMEMGGYDEQGVGQVMSFKLHAVGQEYAYCKESKCLTKNYGVVQTKT